MADGILTPAQSVLGAIQGKWPGNNKFSLALYLNYPLGLEVVKPDISSGTIIGVSCAILIVLFLVQPLGIHKLASAFAPIVIIWLLFNLVFGIYVSLTSHGFAIILSRVLTKSAEPCQIRCRSAQSLFSLLCWALVRP